MTREERRKSILEASKKVFAVYGFDKSKMADIARKAGIGKGTLYEYFDSKKELFQEMIRHNASQNYKEAVDAIHGVNSARDRLVAFAVSRMKFLEHHFDVVQIVFARMYSLTDDMKIWLGKVRLDTEELIKWILTEGKKSGELDSNLDIELAGELYIGSLNQYCLKKFYFQEGDAPDSDPGHLVDLLINGWRVKLY